MANVLYFLGTKIITYERKDSACSSEFDYYVCIFWEPILKLQNGG